MNPNKKDNNGWILCPSKSFPGKFYYFNVLNGEAAWSLTEVDQKTMAKENIQNLQEADKSHTYPEPLGPPVESPIPNFTIQKPIPKIIRRVNNSLQSAPMFGQAMFPTYVSNVDPYMQNIIWAPIQLPMFPSQPMHDQGMQCWEPGRQILVQSCNIPLSKRFTSEPKTNAFQTNMMGQVFGQSSQNIQLKQPNFASTSKVFGGIVCQNDEYKPKQVSRQKTLSESDSVLGYFGNDTFRPPNGTLLFNENRNNESKKVERQRTKSESDSVIGFYDYNGAVTPTNDEKSNTVNKINYFDSIKKVGRQRTLSDSDSIIFEKSKIDQPKSVFKPNFEINKFEKQNVASATNRSSFTLKKPVLNLNIGTSYYKSAGNLEKEGQDKKGNKESSLWCNQEKSNLKRNDKLCSFLVNNKSAESGNNKSVNLRTLDANDLRHTLEKKRKCVDSGRMHPVAENHHNAPELNANQKPAVKKRVVFNVASSHGSSEGNVEHHDNQSPTTVPLCDNENNDFWYIVVDTQVLIDDFGFIDKFVLLDKKCRLFIPTAVRSEIERFCFGDCRGQRRVIVARQLTRRLATPAGHVVVQQADTEDQMFSDMSTGARILNCCMQILQQDERVILVTDDPKLYEKAETLKINCFKLEELKSFLNPNMTSSKPHKNISHHENTLNFFESFKKTLESKGKHYDEHSDKNTTDANTSPINFDEKLVKKKEKSRNYLNFNYDSDSDASIISKTMEKLALKDDRHFVNEQSNQFGERSSFTFKIKNKNVFPQNESKSSQQLHNTDSKKELHRPNFNVQSQIQNKNATGQKEVEDNKKNRTSTEQFKNSVAEMLKQQRFQVKSKFMYENIRTNIEEWICTYRQLMEHALHASFQEQPQQPLRSPLPSPLLESVSCVLPPASPAASLADELALMMINNCDTHGNIKRDIKPEEFMRMFGCGVLLVEYLQASGNPSVSDSQQLLQDMLRRMQRGSEVVDLAQSPAVRGAGEPPPRHNFAKKTSDIINYLKCHFPAWQGYTESPLKHDTEEVITRNDNKIVRTFGRNLNLLTIDHTKSMTMKKSTEKSPSEEKPNFSRQNSSDPNVSENTFIHSQSTVKLHNEPNIVRIFNKNTPFPKTTVTTENLNMTPKHGNTFGFQETSGPKVIRNIKLIDEFEDKLKSKIRDDFSPNYDSFSTDISLCTSSNDFIYDKNIPDGNYESNVSLNDENSLNDVKEHNNDLDKPNDTSTNDSGFVNENDTYSLLQTFFSELSASMKLIYEFIDESMKEYRKADLQSGKKKSIFDKAIIAHGHLTGIIYKLQCIIQRESQDVTPLKEMISKADVTVVDDKRLIRHRQVVSKCLEQAKILEGSLKLLLAITEGDYDVTPGCERPTFLNIFE